MRRGRTDLGARVAQGLGAGAVAGALIALLALSIHLFKLRRVFIALKKDLLDILSFDQSIGAAVAILVFGGRSADCSAPRSTSCRRSSAARW